MVEAMSAEAAKAKGATGDGMGKGVFYGPINNKMQLNRIEELVDDAKVRTARM